MAGLDILFMLIAITLWVYILGYIYKLESIGCECSEQGWMRNFVKYSIGVIITLIVLRIFDLWTFDNLAPAVVTLEFIFMTVFVMVSYHYIHFLKKKKCLCSEDKARDIFEVVNYIQLFLLLLAYVVSVHLVVVLTKLSHTAFKNKQSQRTPRSISKVPKSRK